MRGEGVALRGFATAGQGAGQQRLSVALRGTAKRGAAAAMHGEALRWQSKAEQRHCAVKQSEGDVVRRIAAAWRSDAKAGHGEAR